MALRGYLLAALFAGAATACGSGGNMPTGSNTSTGGGGGGGGTTGGGGVTPTAAVSVQDFSFYPSTVSVRAGTVVTWSNVGAATHHPVADGGAFDLGDLAPAQSSGAYGMSSGMGGTGSFTFSTPGMYSYHCSIHPQMTGTITVTQ